MYIRRISKAGQAEAKFQRISELDGKFDKIRQSEFRQRAISISLKCARTRNAHTLSWRSGFARGSDTDTKAKVKAYGATTLQGKHVMVEGEKVFLRFTGKKGVSLNLPVDDPGNSVEILKKPRGFARARWKAFPTVTDKSLLEYTHTLNGGSFKTKDFRTLLASREALNQIKALPIPKGEAEYKKRVKEVATVVSKKLGNTPTVALQSYINPAVFASWRQYAAA